MRVYALLNASRKVP